MLRSEAEGYIAEKYGVSPEYPWISSPDNAVFRHCDNKKWFALIMKVASDKLGMDDNGTTDIINVKCDRLIIGSLLGTEGFFPAYHMNKNNWISAALDGSVPDDTIRWLIDMSFDATSSKKHTPQKTSETRTERIIRMEHYYDELCRAAEDNAEQIKNNTVHASMLRELVQYYEGGQWLSDYQADERGELPSELKRGVLSEDGVYNLLSEIMTE